MLSWKLNTQLGSGSQIMRPSQHRRRDADVCCLQSREPERSICFDLARVDHFIDFTSPRRRSPTVSLGSSRQITNRRPEIAISVK